MPVEILPQQFGVGQGDYTRKALLGEELLRGKGKYNRLSLDKADL